MSDHPDIASGHVPVPASIEPAPSSAVDGAPARLQAQGLVLSWDGRVICEGITFEVRQGELLCLLGRSGSGKTTIFHALAGLTRPDSGKVLLDGEDITGIPGKVSYMLQKDLLLDQHTIVDNASMPLRVKGMGKRQAREMASSLFADFGIAGTEEMYPSQLSGGMRQRAALLRTYLMENDVVLMDEPFSALDAFTRKEMQQWFIAMLGRLGLSSVLVTHDVDEAVAMSDRIMVLSGGPGSVALSRIAGMVDVPSPRDEREGFLLTEEALGIKREVLGLLG